MFSVLSPSVPLIEAVFVVVPVCFNHLNFAKSVELESLIADHIGEVPLLDAFLIVVVLEFLELVAEREVHFLEGVVYLIAQRSGDALDVGILGDVLLEVFEDDLELLHELLVQLLGFMLQMIQFVLLVLDLVLSLENYLLLTEQLVFRVKDSPSQCGHRCY